MSVHTLVLRETRHCMKTALSLALSTVSSCTLSQAQRAPTNSSFRALLASLRCSRDADPDASAPNSKGPRPPLCLSPVTAYV